MQHWVVLWLINALICIGWLLLHFSPCIHNIFYAIQWCAYMLVGSQTLDTLLLFLIFGCTQVTHQLKRFCSLWFEVECVLLCGSVDGLWIFITSLTRKRNDTRVSNGKNVWKSQSGYTNQPFLCVPHLFATTAIFQALIRWHWWDPAVVWDSCLLDS